MLHIAVFALAIGIFSLLLAFVWISSIVQFLKSKIKFLEDNAFRIFTFDEYCAIRCHASFSCPMRGYSHEDIAEAVSEDVAENLGDK